MIHPAKASSFVNSTPSNAIALIKTVLLSIAPVAIVLAPLSASAQAPAGTPNQVCAFNPEGGLVNPLGMRTFLTISEIDGSSVFVYEQFPSTVASSDNAVRSPATIESRRTLTLLDTPIDEARQQVVDDPVYFAELIGVSVDDLGDRGFGEINATLSCESAANTSDTSSDGMSTASDVPLSNLPNGNYRLTSVAFPFPIVSTQDLLEVDTTVFLFRKRGNSIVGTFGYPETDNNVCISGTLEGNVVTGQASLGSTEATVPQSNALRISGQEMGGRSMDAVLNLNEFSRINAGAVLPPLECR